MIELLSERTHTRRKPAGKEPCYQCCKPIVPGQRYIVFGLVDNGRAYSLHEHSICRSVWEDISRVDKGYYTDGDGEGITPLHAIYSQYREEMSKENREALEDIFGE